MRRGRVEAYSVEAWREDGSLQVRCAWLHVPAAVRNQEQSAAACRREGS